MPAQPRLEIVDRPASIAGTVLVAHGGREYGTAPPSRFSLAALRMRPFISALRRHPAAKRLQVAQVRYRARGYNGGDPVVDVEWALEQLAAQQGGPVVLLGHSMGARASLLAAGHPSVIAVAALSPWCPPDSPVAQLAGRSVMLAQGTDDRLTLPAASHSYALRARDFGAALCRFEIARSGHAMLQRSRLWHDLARDYVLGIHGLIPLDERFVDAFAAPTVAAVAVPL